MDQIRINGYEFVRLNDVCDILRHTKASGIKNADEVVDCIARMMFYNELNAAETEEEKEAAIELPGEFVVCKRLDHINPNGKKMIFFQEFADGEGKAIDNGDKAMRFTYESMADHVAEKLNEGPVKGWRSVCVGIEDGRIAKRLFSGIMRFLDDYENEEEYEEEDK